jgi:hypothetical protein
MTDVWGHIRVGAYEVIRFELTCYQLWWVLYMSHIVLGKPPGVGRGSHMYTLITDEGVYVTCGVTWNEKVLMRYNKLRRGNGMMFMLLHKRRQNCIKFGQIEIVLWKWWKHEVQVSRWTMFLDNIIQICYFQPNMKRYVTKRHAMICGIGLIISLFSL